MLETWNPPNGFYLSCRDATRVETGDIQLPRASNSLTSPNQTFQPNEIRRMPPLIEVCVEGFPSARIAIDAGADRIELNASLALDGLTPPAEDLIACKGYSSIPIIAMLRPHADGFIYSKNDIATIHRSLEHFLELGVDGFAVGCLNAAGRVDIELMKDLRRRSEGKQLVMHRAFDVLSNQPEGLLQLIDLGIDRVLTSGGAPTAETGAEQIGKLVELSRGRIEILPGAGIRSHNAQKILDLTGCNQLHGTFKLPQSTLPDPTMIAHLRGLVVHRKNND